MRSTLPAIAALLLGVALLLLGNGLQGTLLPLRAQIEAFDPLSIGVLGSSYFLGFALGGYFGPRVVRRVGHIRSFAAMVATASAVVLIHSLVISPPLWWAMRVISGACFAVLYIVIESWLNEKSTNESRGGVFAIYAVISFATLGVGQSLLLLGAPDSADLFILSSILVSVAAVPVALTKAEQPAPIQTAEINLKRLFSVSPVGFIGCLSVGVANGAFWSLAPIFAQNQSGAAGGGAEVIAAFMALVILTGAVGQWPLGYLSDRMDRRFVIVGGSAISATIGLSLWASSGLDPLIVLALAGAYGFFAFPLYSLCVAHVNDFVEPTRFVETASGLSLIWGAGAVIGPILGSGAIDLLGAGGMFATTAVFHTALVGFTLYRMGRRAAPPEAERGVFIDAVRVGVTVSTVDPLAETDPKDQAVGEGDAAATGSPDETGEKAAEADPAPNSFEETKPET